MILWCSCGHVQRFTTDPGVCPLCGALPATTTAAEDKLIRDGLVGVRFLKLLLCMPKELRDVLLALLVQEPDWQTHRCAGWVEFPFGQWWVRVREFYISPIELPEGPRLLS